MSAPFETVLGVLARQRGVTAALVVAAEDGIVVDSAVREGVDGDALAALAASLHGRARLSARAAGLGEVTFLQLEAERARLCAIAREELALVVLAEPGANVGLLRVEMLRALDALDSFGGAA
jgi:predicted regulator of Ras-like GTPase activity (Roadblock/LC7/MglB family)